MSKTEATKTMPNGAPVSVRAFDYKLATEQIGIEVLKAIHADGLQPLLYTDDDDGYQSFTLVVEIDDNAVAVTLGADDYYEVHRMRASGEIGIQRQYEILSSEDGIWCEDLYKAVYAAGSVAHEFAGDPGSCGLPRRIYMGEQPWRISPFQLLDW